MCRFYTNLYDVMGRFGGKINDMVEKDINFLVRIEDEVVKRLNEKEN
jgi:hypothetical protein